jgi:Site-specific recombinase XerD
MPKLKNRSPKLAKDKNYAVVYFDGKKVPMGIYGTKEAEDNYRRFLMEWAAIGVCTHNKSNKSYKVDDLALDFLKSMKNDCGKSDFGNYKTAVKVVLNIYSGTLVKDFNPVALKTVQNQFVEKGYARDYCNKLTRFVRKMFAWGAENGLVSPEIPVALKLVSHVNKRMTENRPARKNVPDDVVVRTLPYLLPTIAEMVQVQRLTAMRPSEVCNMRIDCIDCSGETWLYIPLKHKTGWRNHKRIIPLAKPVQEILLRRMDGKTPEQYVFSPTDAMQEKRERDATNRKSKVQPSQKVRKEKRIVNPKQKFREFYTSESYGKSIKNAMKTANKYLPVGEKLVHWTPYQLRHTAITELVRTNGMDVARAVAGQKSISVTMGYAHADTEIAVKAVTKQRNPFA